MGAFAIGAMAVGALAIGRLAVKSAHIGRLEIDELLVHDDVARSRSPTRPPQAPHPNIALLTRFDPRDPATIADVFAEDAVFHFCNPNLPELQGDVVGQDEIRGLFERLRAMTGGTFAVDTKAATPVGDDLVVTQTRNTLTLEGAPVAVDVVEIWRIRDGRIVEAWDIVPTGGPTASPPAA